MSAKVHIHFEYSERQNKALGMVKNGASSTSESYWPLGSPGPLEPWIPWGLRTLEKLPLPFEIQNLNTQKL